MKFSIEFYKSHSGNCPIRDFLNELKWTDPDDFAAVLAGLSKLEDRQYHRPPLSKSIGEDLFEMRHIGKLNTRVIYFFMKGRRIILVHGIRSKAKSIPQRHLKVALARKKEWLKRYSE